MPCFSCATPQSEPHFEAFALSFSGANCEIDVSVCNTTEGKKCQNGGRCVDGLGAKFTCECAQGASNHNIRLCNSH